jgi:hypothetical protein
MCCGGIVTQEVMAPPPLIQRIIFPIVILLEHILGKYRGIIGPGRQRHALAPRKYKLQGIGENIFRQINNFMEAGLCAKGLRQKEKTKY